MKKKILIFLFLIVVVGLLVYQFVFNKEDNKDLGAKKETEATKEVKDFTEKTFKEGQTIEELEKISNGAVFSEDILIGKDSYLREVPSVNTEKMDKYLKAQKKYASRVEDYIKNNIDYNMEDTVTSIEGIVSVTVTFKAYYYKWYLDELKLMEENLNKMSGYNPDATFDGKPSQDTNEIYFKIKVKAMEILDDYLDDYVNNYEHFTSVIKYDPKSESDTKDSQMMYYSNLSGRNFPSLERTTENYQKKINSRVSKMIETAKQNGTLDPNNPLKLK